MFDIGKKRAWEAATNTYSSAPTRYADCYVFCLVTSTDPAKQDPLDLGNWRFWILATTTIDATLGDQKSMSLSTLEKLTGAIPASELLAEVIAALGLEDEVSS